jgi:hypothetical protein
LYDGDQINYTHSVDGFCMIQFLFVSWA